MSQDNDTFNPFDPTGMFKNMRDSCMDSWSKMMIQAVNTDEYARATGTMLDTWLTTSAPFRQMMEKVFAQVLSSFNMPSKQDVIRLAERLTSIELRLDDLDAKLEKLRETPGRNAAGPKAKPSVTEK